MRFKGKTAFVTGSNGFVGSFLVEALLKEGARVKCLVRKTSNLRWLNGLNIEYIHGDIGTDNPSLDQALKNVDYVFHVAALKHSTKWKDYKRINIEGTAKLLVSAKNNAVQLKKFIFLSSIAVMGCSTRENPLTEENSCNPLTNYGKSKKEAESEVLKAKDSFPVAIIRPPAVYGPRDEDIHMMFKSIKNGIRPVFGLGRKYISLVYVADLVEALLLSALKPEADGKAFIIAEDKHYSWKEIQDEVANALGVKAVTVKIPKTILFSAAFFAELFSKATGVNVLLTTHKVREMTGDWVCDIGRAEKELGFKPVYNMKKGIKETAEWYKKNGWL